MNGSVVIIFKLFQQLFLSTFNAPGRSSEPYHTSEMDRFVKLATAKKQYFRKTLHLRCLTWL